MVGLVIGVESVGVPLPGEIVLVTAALMSSQHDELSPLWIAVAATGGDSVGYAIGRRGGPRLFDRAGRRFPRRFGPAHVGKARGVGGVLRAVRGAAAHPGRTAGRVDADGAPEVPGGQRRGRGRVGGGDRDRGDAAGAAEAEPGRGGRVVTGRSSPFLAESGVRCVVEAALARPVRRRGLSSVNTEGIIPNNSQRSGSPLPRPGSGPRHRGGRATSPRLTCASSPRR
ncbi:DedA protein [Actinosynnema pretiosum subsp. pretiosum]|nr:DedA protein [Actinosynnema pretiosum subsp. pretiosum]